MQPFFEAPRRRADGGSSTVRAFDRFQIRSLFRFNYRYLAWRLKQNLFFRKIFLQYRHHFQSALSSIIHTSRNATGKRAYMTIG